MLQRFFAAIYDWLAPAGPPVPADAIFVLAGRQPRKVFALELYRQGFAPTLLLSVGRYEIRRFALLPWPAPIDLLAVAASTPPGLRHYFVALEAGSTNVTRIEKGRWGTLYEMRALAGWLRARPHLRSLLIVSSGFHLRRVRMCAAALLPASVHIRYLDVPHDDVFQRTLWWRSRASRAVVLREFPKLVAYSVALLCNKLHFLRPRGVAHKL